MREIFILGAGYTGSRVAQRLQAEGRRVHALRRTDLDFSDPGSIERLAALLSHECVILHSVPTLDGGGDRDLVRAFHDKPSRVVYLSTTAVYGDAVFVDEHTATDARTDRQRARLVTERAILDGRWSALVLRPAAIYGPERGVHASMAQGRFAMSGDGSNYISRIHVDDLAAIAHAALFSDVTGAFPVADQHPCPSREIAEFCSVTFGLPMPRERPPDEAPRSRRTNRRVDGGAICGLLGVRLRYPSYREGLRS